MVESAPEAQISDPPSFLQLMERMVRSNETSVAHSVRLEELIIKNHRSRRLEFRIQLATALAVLAIVGFLVWSSFDSKEKSAQGREILKQNTQVLKTMQDCTVEGGRCKAESDKKFRQLLQYQYSLAVCARRDSNEKEFQDCVKAANPGQ